MLSVLSLLAFILMVFALAVLLMTQSLFSPNPVVILAQVAAVLLLVWARITFGRRSFHAGATPTPGGLVTTGPYRVIRHPIYTAVCLFGWAGVAAHWNLATAALGLLLFLGALIRMLCEERLLREAYPDYRDYAGRTKRMIPGVF
jgi:protein-S-isoprenylcysteine O-methyltransferase Ste14